MSGLTVTKSPDQRSPIAIGYEWSSRVVAISLEMVVPGLAGYWLDGRLGTRALFTLLGFALGMYVAIRHLIALTATTENQSGPPDQGTPQL